MRQSSVRYASAAKVEDFERLHAADVDHARVVKFDSSGKQVTTFGSKGTTLKLGPGTWYLVANAPSATVLGTYGISIGTVSISATSSLMPPVQLGRPSVDSSTS